MVLTLKISVKISNGDKIVTGLKRFEKLFLSNIMKAAKTSNVLVKNQIQYSMKRGTWPPNAADYLKWKSQYGFSTNPLFRTSLLHNSISHKIKHSSDSIGGEIGWYSGARYPGDLKGKIWRGRVPNRGKKNLAPPSGMLGNPKATSDTNYLSQVAYWNEHGTEGTASTVRVSFQVKNGFRRDKQGNSRQKYKNRYYDKQVYSLSGRPPRPFVARAVPAATDHIETNFVMAMRKTTNSVFGRGRASVAKVLEDAPF